MRLSEAVAQYSAFKQSMGMRFHTETRTLRSFCRTVGDVALADIQADRVYAYIAGTGPVTRFWHCKHEALRGFYRFAIGRGYTDVSPLPKLVPKPPPAFVPYIYSRDELRRLLEAATICENPRSQLQPIPAGCSFYCCMGRVCGSVRHWPSPWPKWIWPPLSSRFAKASSTRRGSCPVGRISRAPWLPTRLGDRQTTPPIQKRRSSSREQELP